MPAPGILRRAGQSSPLAATETPVSGLAAPGPTRWQPIGRIRGPPVSNPGGQAPGSAHPAGATGAKIRIRFVVRLGGRGHLGAGEEWSPHRCCVLSVQIVVPKVLARAFVPLYR